MEPQDSGRNAGECGGAGAPTRAFVGTPARTTERDPPVSNARTRGQGRESHRTRGLESKRRRIRVSWGPYRPTSNRRAFGWNASPYD